MVKYAQKKTLVGSVTTPEHCLPHLDPPSVLGTILVARTVEYQRPGSDPCRNSCLQSHRYQTTSFGWHRISPFPLCVCKDCLNFHQHCIFTVLLLLLLVWGGPGRSGEPGSTTQSWSSFRWALGRCDPIPIQALRASFGEGQACTCLHACTWTALPEYK